MPDHRDQFIDAISAAASIADDADFGLESAKVYRDMADELDNLLPPGGQPSLAFLSFVPQGARNQVALTALLQDRLIVSWQQGLFRKKFGSLTVPFATITAVSTQAVAQDRSLGGNPTLSIEGQHPIVMAIPPKGSPLAESVRDAIVEATGAH